jgi:poly(A) polymerase
MVRLAHMPWENGPGTLAILAALGAAEGETRVVGGAVRDSLLGAPVSDFDLATRLLPDEVIRRLDSAGLRAVPTGLAHGTVTAVAPGAAVEVTTLRRDVTTDGRHAVVVFTDDWREDAARRDFTINALYTHPITGEVSDYFGGLDDLEHGRVRFIGDAEARIREDRLRILRFFRFTARYGRGEPDASGLAACIAHAGELEALSRERIRDELLKLLCVVDPVPTLRIMLDHRVFERVLPELESQRLKEFAELASTEAGAFVPCHPLRRLAALVAPDATRLGGLADRLRLSTSQRARLVALAARNRVGPDTSVDTLAYRMGPEAAGDLLLMSGARDRSALAAALARLNEWRRPQLPVSGRDLLDLGFAPGQQVGHLLRSLEDRWIASGFALGRAELLDLARLAEGGPKRP